MKLVSNFGGISIKDGFSDANNNSQNDCLLWNENTSSKKQGRIGSLSFNVIDTPSLKQSTEFSRPVVPGDAGDSTKNVREEVVARKPAPRVKVPFEKGHSQMDWLKLTRTHPDLAGDC